tara:strand:+ start:1427 stop:1939 length:513 start_codon:yes stop_codon:yes gene_type:complete
MDTNALAPNPLVHDTYFDTGSIGGGLSITGIATPIETGSEDLPTSLWDTWIANPFEYVRDKAVDGFAYVLGHGGFDAMTAAYNGVETPVLIASNIDRYTEDPQAIQDAFFANFTEEQRDTVQATETLISGAVPFSQTIGKVFANPILLLTLVVAAMALWFIGPMFKRVTS